MSEPAANPSERRDSVATDEPVAAPPALPPAGPDADRPEEPERPLPPPHSHKFLAAKATLIGFAIGAVVIAVLLATGTTRSTSGPQWSTWSPPDSGIAGEREIANLVGPFYRAAPAAQLAIITVRNINGNSTATASPAAGALTQIALRDPSSGSLTALSGTTAVYTLCGLGADCAIAPGQPSTARLLLLRREALELALYTFKYIGGVDNVMTILPPGKAVASSKLTPSPPGPGSKTTSTTTINIAVLFQRQGLQRYLGEPLRATLPGDIPPTVSQMPSAPEAELVSVLTSQTLFQEHVVQAQDGSGVLVLDPMPAQ